MKEKFIQQLEAEMAKLSFSRKALAEEMGTSRMAVQRLLDPKNNSITLKTMVKAASAVKKQLRIWIE